jgi:hypothetical protein
VWGVALAAAWRLLGCFRSRGGAAGGGGSGNAGYPRREREHVRLLLQRWDQHFNLDRSADRPGLGASAAASGFLHALVERCQTRDQADPAASLAPVTAVQHARLREALWPAKRAVLRELVAALAALDPSLLAGAGGTAALLSGPVRSVLGCDGPADAPAVFGRKLWARRAMPADHDSHYRVRKCLATFRALRGPPAAPAALLCVARCYFLRLVAASFFCCCCCCSGH